MHLVAFFLENQVDPELIQHLAVVMLAIIPLIILVAIVIVMVPFWFILKKAGFSPWLSLVCVVPSLGTLILLYVLAFSQWKVIPAPQQAWIPPQPPAPPSPPQA